MCVCVGGGGGGGGHWAKVLQCSEEKQVRHYEELAKQDAVTSIREGD